jgi:hypothetical protein
MPQLPPKGTSEYLDYVIQLGKTLLSKGIINEPRLFFDEITLNSDRNIITSGQPEVFYNGEQFPIRLTHIVAAVRYLTTDAQPSVANPLDVGRIGVRFQFHNQFYMNREPLPLTLWGNKVVAAPEAFSAGNAHWDFVACGQPLVLAVRDTFQIRVQLQDASDPSDAVPVAVAFHGIGALSHRPYILTGSVQLETTQPLDFTSPDFTNSGSEPILITDMTVTVGAAIDQSDPTGAIGRIRIKIRQVGNGTQADWFVGPQNINAPYPQATLLGLSTGRAVVHQFPGDGMIWNPGEGVTVDVRALVDELPDVLCIGMAGYIMVS